ncbi:MAG: PQQ-binding-like beta-propeller repeat protein, partial [Planctomycetota bacterium]
MRASPATQPRILHLLYPVLLFLGAASAAALAGGAGTNPAGADRPKDPFKDSYRGYRPAYVAPLRENDHFRDWRVSRKKMRLSSEGAFFTLNQLPEDARANALVEAGVEKEQKGLYRQALQIYHRLITRYPGKLYRVSRYGVFVPVSQYAQRRLLNFPPQHLEHYRTLHDPAAKEAFESARRKHSLIGLSEIVDTMLATSYGGRALMELGNASLDTGHHLAALERFDTIRRFLPYPELRTPELNLKVRLCHRMLGQEPPTLRPPKRPGRLSTPQLEQLRKVLGAAEDERPATFIQRRSPPALSAQDYAPFVPSTDPLALDRPVWQKILPGARRDRIVFSHPVVTGNSVIYRHKNIVYCRSILNGALRWKNDLGGRAGWHDDWLRQYPYEDVLVQDGLVFTAMYKGGPSLVALDEVTGQLRWAYGPMVASTADEARMRFLVAPAGGPRTVFAPYILDNIQGETHTDTEYGLIAFDSASGRIRWRRELCR